MYEFSDIHELRSVEEIVSEMILKADVLFSFKPVHNYCNTALMCSFWRLQLLLKKVNFAVTGDEIFCFVVN